MEGIMKSRNLLMIIIGVVFMIVATATAAAIILTNTAEKGERKMSAKETLKALKEEG